MLRGGRATAGPRLWFHLDDMQAAREPPEEDTMRELTRAEWEFEGKSWAHGDQKACSLRAVLVGIRLIAGEVDRAGLSYPPPFHFALDALAVAGDLVPAEWLSLREESAIQAGLLTRSEEGGDVLGLDSRHAIVVIRATMHDETDPACRWTASLGIGGYTTAVRRPGIEAGRTTGRRVRGAGSWATAEEAEAAGRLAWAKLLAERLEEIRRARGGDMRWGIPVRPVTEPTVLRLSHRGNAWDAWGAAQ